MTRLGQLRERHLKLMADFHCHVSVAVSVAVAVSVKTVSVPAVYAVAAGACTQQ